MKGYKPDIVIVGGGASGLTAAIFAARKAPGAAICILERLDRVGKKLLTTGNGRCNITNRDQSPERYHTAAPATARQVLAAFPLEKTQAFFEDLGLLLTFDENGRAYPYSLQASAVLDALRAEAEALGVSVRCGVFVTGIRRSGEGFVLTIRQDEEESRLFCRRVILAAGGSAAPKLGSDGNGCRLLAGLGHPILSQTPAIVQLKTDTTWTRPLKGVKIQGRATLYITGKRRRSETGEILFTDYGLSGPPVLQISREAARDKGEAAVSVDCMPEYPFHRVGALLRGRAARRPGQAMEAFFTGLLHKRLGQVLIKSCGLSLHQPAGKLTPADWKALTAAVKDFRFPVTGTTGFSNAQTTAGGAALRSFHERTLESRLIGGLFACGEVLDVDGDCGGYNLQWAWASGYVAGRAAAGSLGAGSANQSEKE